MVVHDWSRVSAGVWHDFHTAWIVALRDVLNGGLLPPDYYASAEQIIAGLGPDVLALQAVELVAAGPGIPNPAMPATELLAPPKTRFTATALTDAYVGKQRIMVIRHSGDNRVVARIEIISPGNKSSRHALKSFVDKAVTAMVHGYHLLLIDLHPPGCDTLCVSTIRGDPQGIHGVLWAEIDDAPYAAPPDKPLTAAAYATSADQTTAYVEPLAVGDTMPDMPLFLDPAGLLYVNVPLDATYNVAWRGTPRRWRTVLEM